jgi:flagellar biosynthesis/type III secretory pathway protein FliH
MYNRLVVPRSAIPWQPASKLDLRRSEVGYDTTVWGEDEPQDFADAPYPENLDGFATDAHTSVTQTLTEQAKLSLALLQEQETQASFDSNLTAPKTSASVNEHLPFVMDDYAAARRIKVLLAKGLLDKKNVGRFVDGRDISDSADTNDDLKIAQSHLEATQEALDAITAESSGQSTEEQIDEPEVQAEAKGIPLEEVVQREEAQFSKGLAQGIEEGKAEGFEAGKAQGLEEGKALGLEEGKGQGLEEAVQEALEKGKAQGLEEGISRGIEQGERQAREAMEQEVATQCEVLSQVSEGLHDLLQDPQRFFNPLKRLALNMAQHIAKHEISISPHAIDALVQNCLNELDHPIKGAVVVELNPQDKKLLETLTTASLQGVHLEAVPQLASGSVRVIANDMVVEDLIENRLEALTRSLALKEVTPRAEPVVETNKNPETEVQEASIELSEEASPEASPEAPEELSFEPTFEVDEQIKKDDGEAEDVHS